MGGTQLLRALQKIVQQGIAPANIFLLTDGEVNDTQDVVAAAGGAKDFCRIFSIGVGNGCRYRILSGIMADF